MASSVFGQLTTTQPTAITIPDDSAATPSVLTIPTNVVGTIEKVTVTLNSLKHDYSSDLGVLLVGPKGENVVLMYNAGSGLVSGNITFSDSASSSLPSLQQGLITGSLYKPTSFNTDNDSFLGTAPAYPYGSALSVFAKTIPVGDWKLYVQDNSPVYTGSIGSWSLNLWTTPIVKLVTNTVTAYENGSTTLPFLVFDSNPTATLTVSAYPTDATLSTNFSGSITGTNGTLTIKPNFNAFGTNTVALVVDDGMVRVTNVFTLEVVHVNQAPSIALSTNSISTVQTWTSPIVSAIVSDPESPVSALTFSATSDNTNVVDPSGVFFSGTNFTVVPKGSVTGTANLTITVSDGGATNATASTTLKVTVNATDHMVYANSNPIQIGNSGTTSKITVSDFVGTVGSTVYVSFSALTSFVSDNVSLILTSPDTNVAPIVLTSGINVAGNAAAISEVVFQADPTKNETIPTSSSITNCLVHTTALNALIGSNPNGSWSLLATNTVTQETNVVSGGWALHLTAAPTISAIADQTMAEESTLTINFQVGDMDGTVTNITAVAADPTLVDVNVSNNGGKAVLSITGKPLKYGNTTVAVTATDNSGFKTTAQFKLTVSFVNHNPTITTIQKQVARAGEIIGPIPFSVADADLPSQALTVVASSSNTKVLPNENIVLQNTGNDYTITLYPIAAASSSDYPTITLGVTDSLGGTAKTSFLLVLQDADGALFTSSSQITLTGNGATASIASPYPSVNTVTGMTGLISDVQVTLFDFTHPRPTNINVLLVSPHGTNILLLEHAGALNPVTNATLVFSSSATNVLPKDGQIVSGSYLPSIYNENVVFPTNAPAGPYNTNFAALNGVQASGDWKLFVYDDGTGKGGVIANGWQLKIKTAPYVVAPGDQATDENVTKTVKVTVGDAQLSTNVVVTATPTSSSIIKSLTVSGDSATRLLTITPVPYIPAISGSVTQLVTVIATDGVNSSTNWFNFIVNHVDQAPVLSTVANQTNAASTLVGPLAFSVWDPQGSAVTLTPVSGNTDLVPNANITYTTQTINGTNYFGISVLPVGVLTGKATITLNISNGLGKKTSTSFDAVFTPIIAYAQTNEIIIPPGPDDDHLKGASTPYPSAITVSNINGLVTGIRVIVDGFSHIWPSDIKMVLVSPDNTKKVVLMARAGAGISVDNIRFTFDDNGTVPPSGSALTNNAVYKPSNFNAGSLDMPQDSTGNPTSGNYTTTLSSFNGINPNGDWKLYVVDDVYPQGGSIGSWMLLMTTGPEIAPLADITMTENDQPLAVSFKVLDQTVDPTNVTVTASHSNDDPANLLSSLVVARTNGNQLFITLGKDQPSATTITNYDGTSKITLVASYNGASFTNSFNLTVKYANQAPRISTATNAVTVLQNGSATINYSITDPDSAIGITNASGDTRIWVTTSGDNKYLIPATNIVVSGSSIAAGATGTFSVKVTPAANQYGTNQLNLIVSDGLNFSTNTLTLNVQHVYQAPWVDGITNQSIVAGNQSPVYSFSVHSLEVTPEKVYLRITSGNQSLVPNANIVYSQPDKSGNATVQLTPLGVTTGSSVISIYAYDEQTTNSGTTTQFTFNVVPAAETVFGNTNSIALTNTLASSSITVTGLVGKIYNVTVTLQGFAHAYPSHLDALLVGPDTNVMLLSGVGGSTAVSGLRLMFATNGAPLTIDGTLVSGTNQTAYVTKRTLPAPAPTANYGSSLTNFAGGNPNGTWTLYFYDSTTGEAGAVTDGWLLSIATTPTIKLDTNVVTIAENTSSLSSATLNFSINDTTGIYSNLVVSANKSASIDVTLTNVPTGSSNYIATFTPQLLVSGNFTIPFTVTRPSDGASVTTNVIVKVEGTNIPPTISRLQALSMDENSKDPLVVDLQVADVDTALADLTVIATSSDQSVIADTNVVFVGSTNNQLVGLPSSKLPNTSALSLKLMPNTNSYGVSTISITVIDPGTSFTNTVVSNFVVTVVNVKYPPQIASIGGKSVTSGKTVTFPISLSSPNTPAPTMTVSASSANTGIIKNENIVISDNPSVKTSRTVTITAGSVAKETPVAVTLTVTDDGNRSSSTTFAVTVRPDRQHQFGNTNAIVINDNSPATPYPSTITTSNLLGTVTKVSVTLNGFTHTYPSDVGVLLVSPTGTNIVLMRSCGGGSSLTNAQLTFASDATFAIPSGTMLTNGTYLPADYKKGNKFAGSAPATPYSTSLSDLIGTIGNGTWSLYVVDDSASDVGVITGGWSISITTLPSINGVTNLLTKENTPVQTSFSIADDSPATPSFNIGFVSTDESVIPSTNVVSVQDATLTNFNVTVTPALYAFGTNVEVMMYVTNGDNQVVRKDFFVTVTPNTYAPTIAGLTNMVIPAMTSGTNTLIYTNVHVAQTNLSVSYVSSNPNLIPASRISLVGTQLVITPFGVKADSATISVIVKQADSIGGLATTNTFTVTVLPSSKPLFANTTGITINDNAVATPDYPSVIKVSNVVGKITKVSATLLGFQHTYPQDVGVLLVGPANQKIVLMRVAGAGVSVANVDLTFAADAGEVIPQAKLVSGSYKPADYHSSASFLPPADLAPYTGSLSDLVGTSANGEWKLYVEDDYTPDSGHIVGGWALSFETDAPQISTIADQGIVENSTAVIPFTVSSPLMNATNLTATASVVSTVPAGLVTAKGITTTRNATNAAMWSLSITPTVNWPSAVTNVDGVAQIAVAVTDASNTVQTITFNLTVTNVNQAPVVTFANVVTTPANVPLTIPISIADVDTALSNIVVAASVAGTVPANVSVAKDNGSLLFVADGSAAGVDTITLVVSDGTSFVTNQIVVDVTAGAAPQISAIGVQSTLENVTLTVPFTVANVTTNNQLTLSGFGTPSSLIAGVKIYNNLTNYTAVVNLVKYANSDNFGDGTVTLVAADEFGTSTQTFTVHVVSVYNAPVFGAFTNDVVARANSLVRVPLDITAPGSSLTNLTISNTFVDTNLVSKVAFENDGTNITALLTLVHGKTGHSAVSITVSDGISTVAQSFNLVVVIPAAPTLGAITDVTTKVNTPASVTLDVVSSETPLTDLTYSATVNNTNLISGLTFIVTSSNVVGNIDFVANSVGSAKVTVAVSDGVNPAATNSFNVTVVAPTAPTISIASSVTTSVNTGVTVPMTVTSPDTQVGDLVFNAYSSDNKLVRGTFVSYDGENLTLVVDLVKGKAGIAPVTVTVFDGFTTVSAVVDVLVTPPTAPTLAVVDSVTTKENVDVSVPLTVTSTYVPVEYLVLSASTTNSALVKGTLVNYDGTNFSVVVNLVKNQVGTAEILVSAFDGFTTITKTFTVTVNPVIGPTLTAVVVNGAIKFSFVGAPNTMYTVQASSDLMTWTDVSTVTCGADGAASYSTSIDYAQSGKFFRVVLK